VDADVVCAADVPGVSAPNPLGLPGREVADCLRLAGADPAVTSPDQVEISPPHDLDGLSARWAALALWHFLAGLASRPSGQ
jgi:arginase family enzyme